VQTLNDFFAIERVRQREMHTHLVVRSKGCQMLDLRISGQSRLGP
jgi:hypothetical protein